MGNWIRIWKPEPEARLRLLCFPYAGGNAAVYLKWPLLLSPFIEVCAVELPGHGERLQEPPLTGMAAVIRALLGCFPAWGDKPFAFFGHSMGGLIAYELAQALRRQGKPAPLHLFVSGCGMPGQSDAKTKRYQLPEAEFLAQLRDLGGTPPEFFEHAELRDLLLPILRADFQLIEAHEPLTDGQLDCRITALHGHQDADVTMEEVARWQSASSGEFSIRLFDGDHFFIKSREALVINTVLQALAAQIATPEPPAKKSSRPTIPVVAPLWGSWGS